MGSLNNLSTEPSTEAVLARHKSVFEEELGLIQSTTAKIRVDPQAQPIFCKPHSLPYSQKEKVEKELQHLVETGVIEPIEFSDWAAPIVPIVKQDGNIRICGDFRRTVNRAAGLDPYPLPRTEDIFAKLSGGKLFSKLDLAHAFLQIPLDDDSKKCGNKHPQRFVPLQSFTVRHPFCPCYISTQHRYCITGHTQCQCLY